MPNLSALPGATGGKPTIHTQTDNNRGSTAPIRKRKRRRGPLIRFRFGMILFIWFICFASCFAIYMVGQNLFPEEVKVSSKSSSNVDAVETIPPDDTTPLTTKTSQTTTQLVVQTKINPVPEGQAPSANYLSECAFLGDSCLYYIGQSGLIGKMNLYTSETLSLENYAKEYINLNNTQIRILSAISGAKCPIYLLFGTDTLLNKSAEATADQFSVLLNAVKAAAPAAPIFVLSIPPVTKTAETGATPLLNTTIDQYNSILLTLCNQSNVYFVDTNTALKNNESKLDASFAEEDGLHLNATGGRKLLDYVLSHVPA